jgi:hypothetical protein
MKAKIVQWLRRPAVVAAVGALIVAGPLAVRTLPAMADGPSAHHTAPVVGTWVGQVHGAQYEDHLYQFHTDGTMEGTNPQRVQEKPDGTGVNDSLAMGSWHMEHGQVVGVFLELNANQTTHKQADTLTVRFTLEVHGDHLTGTAKVWVGTQQVPDASFNFSRVG